MTTLRNRTLNRAAVVCATVICASPATAQQPFIGTIHYNLENKGKHIQLVAATDGNRIREEFEFSDSLSSRNSVVTIVDYAARTAITLMPQRREYTERQLGRADSAASPSLLPNQMSSRRSRSDTLIATSRHETIAGVDCELYVTGAVQSRPDEYCITTLLGSVGAVGGDAARLDSLGAEMSPVARMFRGRGIVLRLLWNSADPPTRMIATNIDRSMPPGSVFAVPPGYRRMGEER